MNFNYFEKNFKEEVDELIDNGIICDENGLNVDTSPSWTFLINVAIYKVVEKYNKIEDELCLIPEGNSGRKDGFYDFKIKSDKDEKSLFEIEHENEPNRLLHGYEKLIKSDAENKILIGYEYKNMDKTKIINLLKNRKISLKTNETVYFFIAPEKMTIENSYKVEKI